MEKQLENYTTLGLNKNKELKQANLRVQQALKDRNNLKVFNN